MIVNCNHLIVLLIVAFFGVATYADYAETIFYGELHLDDQWPWSYYNGGDSPDGGYLAFIDPSNQEIKATITTKKSLPAGNYNAYFKGICYDVAQTMLVSLGGSPNVSKIIWDRNADKWWTGPFALSSSYTSNQIVVSFQRISDQNPGQIKYLFLGAFITDLQSGVVVPPNDIIVNLNYPNPETPDVSPPEPGNLLENPSFEVGFQHGWSFSSARSQSIDDFWDSTTGYHGSSSIKLTEDSGGALYTKIYNVKPKNYTFSCWLKSEVGIGQGALLYMTNSFQAPYLPDGYQVTTNLWAGTAIPSTWTRISVSGYLDSYPTGDYYFWVEARNIQSNPGSHLWIDACQLEEGNEPSSFVMHEQLEIGVQATQIGHIYYDDEPITIKILGHNEGDEKEVCVTYAVYDIYNTKVAEDFLTIRFAANGTTTKEVNLPVVRGSLRITALLPGFRDSIDETVISVIPRPPATGQDPTSVIGVSPNFFDMQLARMERLGIKWVRAMSPASFMRWNVVEPTKGNFIYYDKEIALAKQHNMMILGTLSTNNYWPSFANSGSYFSLTDWADFVRAMVAHYNTTIQHWEIWNEPIYNFPESFYAQVLDTAATVIRQTNPQAKIIGMGGSYSATWCQNVLDVMGAGWQNKIDVLATHLYPGYNAFDQFNNSFISKGLPVWNTETGAYDQGMYMTSNSNYVEWGIYVDQNAQANRYVEAGITSPEKQVKNFIWSVAFGQTNYFYYDSRMFNMLTYFRSHPSLLEQNDDIRPKGVMYAVAAVFLDHAIPQGSSIGMADLDIVAYLFMKDGYAIIAAWSSTASARRIHPELDSSEYMAMDVFLNPIPTSGGVYVGRMPTFIKSKAKVTSDYFRSGFTGIPVTNETDTTPPKLSFVHAPTGRIDTNFFYARWVAIDEHDLYATYSYRITGSSKYGSWSEYRPAISQKFTELSQGSYTLEVKAKDSSNNVSPVEQWPIYVQQDPLAFTCHSTSVTSESTTEREWIVSTAIKVDAGVAMVVVAVLVGLVALC